MSTSSNRRNGLTSDENGLSCRRGGHDCDAVSTLSQEDEHIADWQVRDAIFDSPTKTPDSPPQNPALVLNGKG